MNRLVFVWTAAACLLAASLASATETVRFRGPAADGKYEGTGLLKAWPAEGPKLLWSAQGLGEGFSSAVVSGDTVYVTGRAASGQGVLFAFGPDGAPKWKAEYGPELPQTGPSVPGSRGTPTVDGGLVFIVSGFGTLTTIDAKSGTVVRTVDLVKQFGGKQPNFGFAESVLVDGDRVICTPAGPDAFLVAFDKKSGKVLWQTAGVGEGHGYCSPVLVQHGGKRLVVTATAASLIGVDAESGKLLWKYAHANRFGVQPNPPTYADGVLYMTSGGASGGVALDLSADGSSVTEKWVDKELDCQMQGTVLTDGCIYGTGQAKKGLSCVDFKAGKLLWRSAETPASVVIFADGMLYLYGGDGVMRLVKPSRDALAAVSQFAVTAGSGQHWAHPTIADGRLYVRHGDALQCYNIKE